MGQVAEIQLSITLPGSIEDLLELAGAEAKIRRYVAAILLCDVVAEENLAITLDRHVSEEPANQGGVLVSHHLAELARTLGQAFYGRFIAGVGSATCDRPVVVDRKVPGQGAQETRELLRYTELTPAQFLEGEAKGLLKEIFGLGTVAGVLSEDHRHTTGEALYEALFGSAIPRSDSRHQIPEIITFRCH